MGLNTIPEVRQIAGVKSDIISDDAIRGIIKTVEKITLDILRVNTEPTISIDILKPDHNPQQQLRRKNPLKIISLQVGTRDVDPSLIYLDYISGLISFKPSSGERLFTTSHTDRIKVKYLNAFISKDESVIDEIESDITKGDDVLVLVTNASKFSKDEYFMFEDLTGSVEVAKVTLVDTELNNVTFDNLVNDYLTGSLITKIKTNETLKGFLLYETALAVGNNSIGASYTFNTSYALGPLNVTKGVPHPHFSKLVDELKPIRDKYWNLLQTKLVSIA